jgi:hypothetical protein
MGAMMKTIATKEMPETIELWAYWQLTTTEQEAITKYFKEEWPHIREYEEFYFVRSDCDIIDWVEFHGIHYGTN